MLNNNQDLPHESLEIEYHFSRETNNCGEYKRTTISGPKKLVIGTVFTISGILFAGQVADIPYVPKISIVKDVCTTANTLKFPIVIKSGAEKESR